jgi:LysM repeat protein
MGTERERMAIPASQAEEQPTERLPRLSLPEICPHLGLRGDPASCALFPRPDHVCGVPGAPPPPLEWQAGYCLSRRWAECPHFQAQTTGQAAESTGYPTRWRLGRRAALAVAGTLAVACGLLGVAFARGYISIDVDTIVSTPSPAAGVVATSPAASGDPSPAPAASGTVAPRPTPAAVETPALAATPTATPRPMETPTPLPTPSPRPETHIVAEGETLSEIAARYGTTVEAITELNGLSDPDNIPAGMVLRLP